MSTQGRHAIPRHYGPVPVPVAFLAALLFVAAYLTGPGNTASPVPSVSVPRVVTVQPATYPSVTDVRDTAVTVRGVTAAMSATKVREHEEHEKHKEHDEHETHVKNEQAKSSSE